MGLPIWVFAVKSVLIGRNLEFIWLTQRDARTIPNGPRHLLRKNVGNNNPQGAPSLPSLTFSVRDSSMRHDPEWHEKEAAAMRYVHMAQYFHRLN